MIWRRSSFCDTGTCVLVAIDGDDMLVRDSKEVDGPVLRFDRDEWAAFLLAAKDGEFDVGEG